MIENGEWSVSH